MNKEQCVNKKLHPYYKTGIYGWIGEEVDDNDYIICPICGEVLGMNYWDYSAENNGDNKCPKCKQELDYSEIYYFEDTLYFRQVLESKESRLADLETKLADLQQEQIKEMQEHQEAMELADKTIKATEEQNKRVLEKLELIVRANQELEQKLAEKEKELKQLKLDLGMYKSVNEFLNRYSIEKAREVLLQTEKAKKQLKIEFAIAELEKVKEFNVQQVFSSKPLDNFIDNQIKQLKEME